MLDGKPQRIHEREFTFKFVTDTFGRVRIESALMKYSILLVSVTCLCFGLSASAATMSISSNPGQDVTVKLALPASNTEAGPVSCSFIFQTAKGLLGPSSNPTSQSGFANSGKNLFAVTVEPATKAAFVHFFLTSATGNVILVSDVNARVAKLLSSPWKSDAKEFLRVETIQGRKVKLETIDYSHAPFPTHTFWVRVDAIGGVALAP
jgi:hypothetical protein